MSLDAVRTPDELLEGLPDYPFESRYRELDGLRLAHLDEGEGKPVIFFHGEPTWSFLWRKVVPRGRDAAPPCARALVALHRPRLRRLRPLRQAHRSRLVPLRPPRRADGGAAGGTRPARRDRRRPRLGRANRAATGGRAPGPHLPHRDHGDRAVHRPPEDERRLVRLPRLR